MSRRFGFLRYLGYVIRTGSLAVATVVFDDVNITFDSSSRSPDTPLGTHPLFAVVKLE